MSHKYYILKGKKIVPVDLMKWSRYFENANRHVGLTYIGEIKISTVFLGFDHQYGDGPLLLFETMVFGGMLDQHQQRYSTYDEAKTGHAIIASMVEEAEELRLRNKILKLFKKLKFW